MNISNARCFHCNLSQPELTVENLPSFLALGKALLLLFVGDEADDVGRRQNQMLLEELKGVVELGDRTMEKYLPSWIHLCVPPSQMIFNQYHTVHQSYSHKALLVYFYFLLLLLLLQETVSFVFQWSHSSCCVRPRVILWFHAQPPRSGPHPSALWSGNLPVPPKPAHSCPGYPGLVAEDRGRK